MVYWATAGAPCRRGWPQLPALGLLLVRTIIVRPSAHLLLGFYLLWRTVRGPRDDSDLSAVETSPGGDSFLGLSKLFCGRSPVGRRRATRRRARSLRSGG